MLSKYNVMSLDPFDVIGSTEDNVSNSSTFQPGSEGILIENVDLETSLSSSSASNKQKVVSLSLAAFYTVVNLVVFILLLYGIHKVLL